MQLLAIVRGLGARAVSVRAGSVLNPLQGCTAPKCQQLARFRIPPEAVTDETALERAILLELSAGASDESVARALERVEARHAAGEDVGIAKGAALLHSHDLPGAALFEAMLPPADK